MWASGPEREVQYQPLDLVCFYGYDVKSHLDSGDDEDDDDDNSVSS